MYNTDDHTCDCYSGMTSHYNTINASLLGSARMCQGLLAGGHGLPSTTYCYTAACSAPEPQSINGRVLS